MQLEVQGQLKITNQNQFKSYGFKAMKHSCEAFMNIGKLARKLSIIGMKVKLHAFLTSGLDTGGQ